MSDSQRLRAFAILVLACTIAAAIALAAAVGGGGDAAPAAARDVLAAARESGRPSLLFRNLDAGRKAANGQVAFAGLASPGARTLVPLRCDRVHFGAGSGLCVARGSGFASGYRARIFGPRFAVQHEVGVAGIPSRARVSPDGRYGSVTTFVEGHSYAEQGAFSTQTTLVDMRRGLKLGELEEFAVTRDGARVTAVDVNFWGVTFARNSDRFYATLATGGRTYLIRGSVSQRTAVTIHENVECPSLSPDGSRIAYKRRVGGEQLWRLHVLDLATMRETPLTETRGVDDQVEWLDDDEVAYAVEGDLWAARADGTGHVRRVAAGGESPASLRW